MKNLAIGLIAVFIIIGIGAYSVIHRNANNTEQGKKISIVASFYPMAFFAQQIAGDKATVTNITPAGAEPHDYELSPQDSIRLQKAQLIIINGNVEPWIKNVQENIKNTNVRILSAGDELIKNNDPHVWLSPILAQQEAEKIAQAIIQLDPQHTTYYENNMHVLLEKFQKLDTAYKTGLAHCASQNIITSHAAFTYLADAYGLHQVAVAGLSPDEEPSAKTLADIANFVEQNNVKYIFFESLVSPKLSETIAQETNAQTLELNPLEGLSANDVQQGEDYFTVMQHNLRNIQIALSCST